MSVHFDWGRPRITAERKVLDGPGGPNTRDGTYALEDARVIVGDRRGAETCSRRLQMECEHALRLETGIDRVQAPQRLHHQPGTDAQDHREGYLEGHKRGARTLRSATLGCRCRSEEWSGLHSGNPEGWQQAHEKSDRERSGDDHDRDERICRDLLETRCVPWQDRE